MYRKPFIDIYLENNFDFSQSEQKEPEGADFRTDDSPVSESRSEHKAKAERATGLSAKEIQEADFRTDGIVFARSVTTKQTSFKDSRDCHENQRFSRNDATKPEEADSRTDDSPVSEQKKPEEAKLRRRYSASAKEIQEADFRTDDSPVSESRSEHKAEAERATGLSAKEIQEAKSEIDFVLEILFNYTYKDFILGKTLSAGQISKTKKIIEERVNTKRPIQQIIGQAYFYGRKFLVNESVLIPRPETEILVSEILKLLKNMPNAKILDIGTGSGCIPLTLAAEMDNICIDAVDISLEALETAKKNSLFLNLINKVNFFKSDLFSNVIDKYHIIVSNPPYIPLKDKDSLQIEVRQFEPELALFTKDDNGIEFYEKIISQSSNFLYDEGFLVFEAGINQSQLIKNILLDYNFKDIKICKDLNFIDRVIIAKK